MNKLAFLLVFSMFVTTNGSSQQQRNSSFNFSHHIIESNILNDSVKLVISLPENYASSNKTHPVIYILDGKRFFPQGLTSQIHFERYQLTPDLIVVGIENSDQQRNWYFNKSRAFNQFLAQELIPSIDKKFRTTDERILFGWEISGGFVIEVLGSTPSLFTGYLAASPGPLDSTFMDIFQYRYDKIVDLINSNNDFNSFLYMTTGVSDYPVQYGVDNIIELLKKNDTADLRWIYKKLDNETHTTTAFKTIQSGITSYFQYYPVLRFTSTDDFYASGDHNYLEEYYVERKSKYGFSSEKNDKDYLESCKNIIFNAMTDQDYAAFNNFMKTFLPKKVLSITHYNHASMFATYYLENNNPTMAIELMSYYIQKFPEAARPYNILGDAYEHLNDKKNATKYFQKAVDLGTKTADPRLNEYKKDLESFNDSE